MARSPMAAPVPAPQGYNLAMRWTLGIAVIMAVSGVSTYAHHSIASIYDSANPITLEGTVVDFQFVSPHPFLVIEVAREGRAQRWRLDMDNRRELASVGMTRETFRAGDRIAVTGGPARDRSRSLYIRRLDRLSDGYWYEQVGSSPSVGGR
jgi:hypothetical protein